MDFLTGFALTLLAATFLTAGIIKITQSKERLAKNIPWTEAYSPATLKLLGAVEISGSLGLFLPEVTGIATILTPLAAIGAALIMIGALVVHMRRREHGQTGLALVVLVMATVVAWGRLAG